MLKLQSGVICTQQMSTFSRALNTGIGHRHQQKMGKYLIGACILLQGGRDSITNYYGAICKVDRYKIRGATLADGYDDGLVYDTAMTKRTFIEATEYCESLGGALPTTSQFSTWRNMYTKEEHERYGFHTWNWTSTPKEDGTVPYRSLYTGSGGAASPTSKYGTICHVN